MNTVTNAGIVVTGGGSGIGAALARRFAADGARVVVNDIDAAAASAVADSCGATAVPGDARRRRVAALIAQRPGGARRDRHLLRECRRSSATAARSRRSADWDASWEVNVMGHVRAARLLLGRWLERGSGHLICTVSAAGLLTMPGTASYSVTKHAALSFAEWMAVTYAHQGITVQAICPLGVRTGMLDGTDPAAEVVLGDTVIKPEAVADAVMAGIADGRFLILPHPEVAQMYAGRATDPDRLAARHEQAPAPDGRCRPVGSRETGRSAQARTGCSSQCGVTVVTLLTGIGSRPYPRDARRP